jgi:hypothetical protein
VQLTATEEIVGRVVCVATEIVAVPDLLVSSLLVAVTVTDPVELGAVNNPLPLTVPPLAVHVTAEMKLPVPCTVALHCDVALGAIVEGLHATDTEEIVGGVVPIATVTVAVPDLLESSRLVAVTVTVAAELGAVSIPLALIEPPLAVHVTIELKLPVPCTVALHCDVAPAAMEGGVHTTDTEEMVGEVVVPVLPTDPPPQPALTSSSTDAASTHPSDIFNPLSPKSSTAPTLLLRNRRAHPSPAIYHLCDAAPHLRVYIPAQ